VKEVADLWYTAWVDAGQPDLDALLDYKLSEEDLKEMEEERKGWQQKTLQVRPEETSSIREWNAEELHASVCCRHEHE
jgi:chromatin segregation and condensation protein Rec8/ScpA/Scc1 (kleisin family)